MIFVFLSNFYIDNHLLNSTWNPSVLAPMLILNVYDDLQYTQSM